MADLGVAFLDKLQDPIMMRLSIGIVAATCSINCRKTSPMECGHAHRMRRLGLHLYAQQMMNLTSKFSKNPLMDRSSVDSSMACGIHGGLLRHASCVPFHKPCIL